MWLLQAEGNYDVVIFATFSLSSEGGKKEEKKEELQWFSLLCFFFSFFYFGPHAFFNWAQLASFCCNQKKKVKRLNAISARAECPWDKRRKGNWINPLSLAPPVEQVWPDTRGPLLVELRRSSALRSGCLLHFQQRHELHEHTKTRWRKKKKPNGNRPHTIYR